MNVSTVDTANAHTQHLNGHTTQDSYAKKTHTARIPTTHFENTRYAAGYLRVGRRRQTASHNRVLVRGRVAHSNTQRGATNTETTRATKRHTKTGVLSDEIVVEAVVYYGRRSVGGERRGERGGG